MNIANALTITRIILSPFLYVAGFLGNKVSFTVLFFICTATDGLDGFFARRQKTKSKYGAKLDGFADSLFYPSAVFVIVLVPELLRWWKFIIPVAFLQMLSSFIVWLKGRTNAPHTLLGKVNASVLCIFVLYSLMIGYSFGLLVIMLMLGVISAIYRMVS